MQRPAVTVLVRSLGQAAQVEACLRRLRPTLGPGDRVVVLVPHDAAPHRVRVVPLLGAHPGETPEQLTARARSAAGTPLVAELHADVAVTPHWLDRLADALDDAGVDVVGPRSSAAPPGQVLTGAYDDGVTSLRDFARVRAASAPVPAPPARRLAGSCRLSRREVDPALVPLDRSRLVHAVFVHHDAAPGCPDVRALPEPDGAPLLSGSLIVKDEEDLLPGCLASLAPFVDELVVYDTGSTDATVALAEAAGARVVRGVWDDDFGAARARALEHCAGRWVVVLDADEVLEGDPTALRSELRATTERVYAVTIDNLASGGTGTTQAHHAHRLFRRAGTTWVGRLHEQVTDERLGHVVDGPVHPALRIVHSGYTPERFAQKDKLQRNLELAEAGLRAAEQSGSATGLALNNLARAVFAAGDPARAMGLFERAWDGSRSRSSRIMCSAAVSAATDLGDRAAGERWLRRLVETGETRPRADVLHAQLLGSTGDVPGALALVEQLPERAVDDEGVVFERTSAAALHAGLLGLEGRHDEAAGVALGALEDGVSDWHLARHLVVLRRAGRPVADLARALHPRLRLAFLAQCLQVPAADGAEVLDALWAVDPGNDVLAAASAVRGLPVPAALEWSARLRERGLADRCPLVQAAADADRSPRDRVVAAAVAHTTFADPRALPLLEQALPLVAAEDEPRVLDELRLLAPGLVEPATA